MAKMFNQKLPHLAGAHDEDLRRFDIREELLGQFHRNTCDTDPPSCDRRARIYFFARGKRRVEEPVEDLAAALCRAGHRKALFDLTDDLRLADNHTVEAGTYGQQVRNSVIVESNIEKIAKIAWLYAARFRHKVRQIIRFDRVIARSRTVQLDAIAGRKQGKLDRGESTLEIPECIDSVIGAERQLFPDTDRSGLIVYSQNDDLHDQTCTIPTTV
jgi:hypothetical protein